MDVPAPGAGLGMKGWDDDTKKPGRFRTGFF